MGALLPVCQEGILTTPYNSQNFNAIVSVGAFIFGFTQLLLLFIVIKSIRTGKKASDEVWEDTKDWGLEWTLDSPPPYHSFTVQPEVK
ncbi:MAG: hypothetical protein CM1200mP16_15930 [Nitrospina sp.]|nr:MAG: hypothetical protein CM1200mP16_15930 [Nitrospina sp.]